MLHERLTAVSLKLDLDAMITACRDELDNVESPLAECALVDLLDSLLDMNEQEYRYAVGYNGIQEYLDNNFGD